MDHINEVVLPSDSTVQDPLTRGSHLAQVDRRGERDEMPDSSATSDVKLYLGCYVAFRACPLHLRRHP